MVSLTHWWGIHRRINHQPVQGQPCNNNQALFLLYRAGKNWWWVPIVAPCVGALFGTLLYQILVEIHHPAQETKAEEATYVETPAEKMKEIPVFTINLDNSLCHRL